jgi:hypothetical protein
VGPVAVLPVGHDLGAFHDGTGGRTHQVRVGATVEELSDAEYNAWSAAHSPEGAAPDDALGLSARGLLAEVTDPVEFAARHRLVPLALGLGNTSAEPWLFTAGLLDQPVVAMTGALYDLWQWAHLSPDLWTACHETAAVALQAGMTDPEQTDPARVLDGALESVPPLLAARVACFDVRIEAVR